eukprot:Clim_evm2s150 gene=Clim_evmTU2s150
MVKRRSFTGSGFVLFHISSEIQDMTASSDLLAHPQTLADRILIEWVDGGKVDKFLRIFEESTVWYYNNVAVTGPEACNKFLASAATLYKSTRHHSMTSYTAGNVIFTVGQVEYTKNDETKLDVQFIDMFQLADDATVETPKMKVIRTVVDNHALGQ